MGRLGSKFSKWPLFINPAEKISVHAWVNTSHGTFTIIVNPKLISDKSLIIKQVYRYKKLRMCKKSTATSFISCNKLKSTLCFNFKNFYWSSDQHELTNIFRDNFLCFSWESLYIFFTNSHFLKFMVLAVDQLAG